MKNCGSSLDRGARSGGEAPRSALSQWRNPSPDYYLCSCYFWLSGRLTAEIGADASLSTSYGPAAILSRDGTRLAFVALGADKTVRIYVHSLDNLHAAALSGTEHAESVLFTGWPVDRLLRRRQAEEDRCTRRRGRYALRSSGQRAGRELE